MRISQYDQDFHSLCEHPSSPLNIPLMSFGSTVLVAVLVVIRRRYECNLNDRVCPHSHRHGLLYQDYDITSTSASLVPIRPYQTFRASYQSIKQLPPSPIHLASGRPEVPTI